MIDQPLPLRPTALAHLILGGALKPGDLAIDATAGNGHDTLFLAERVGADGTVLAFDIQTHAVAATRDAILREGLSERVRVIHACHTRMGDHAPSESAAAIMFNLGYLPGHDHRRTTTCNDTIVALDAAIGVLRPGGVLSVICYPGHDEGRAESSAVLNWFMHLPSSGGRVARYEMLATLRPAPFLLLGYKARVASPITPDRVDV